MREVIITSILHGFVQKNNLYDGWSWFKFNNLVLPLGMDLKYYTSVVVIPVKVLGANFNPCRSYRGETGMTRGEGGCRNKWDSCQKISCLLRKARSILQQT